MMELYERIVGLEVQVRTGAPDDPGHSPAYMVTLEAGLDGSVFPNRTHRILVKPSWVTHEPGWDDLLELAREAGFYWRPYEGGIEITDYIGAPRG